MTGHKERMHGIEKRWGSTFGSFVEPADVEWLIEEAYRAEKLRLLLKIERGKSESSREVDE